VLTIVNIIFFQRLNKKLWYRLYADDLVFIIMENEETFLANLLIKVSNKYNIRIKKKISSFMPIKY
jgi:hypothetical protein